MASGVIRVQSLILPPRSPSRRLKRQMQLRVPQVHLDPFVVGQASEDRMRLGGGFAREAAEGLAEARQGFGRGDDLGRQGSTGRLWQLHAWFEGFGEDPLLHRSRQQSEEGGNLERITLVGEVDPGGQMVEGLAERPSAKALKLLLGFGVGERVDIGQNLINRVEAERSSNGCRHDLGCLLMVLGSFRRGRGSLGSA